MGLDWLKEPLFTSISTDSSPSSLIFEIWLIFIRQEQLKKEKK